MPRYSELLPCPFCGTSAVLKHVEPKDRADYWWAGCEMFVSSKRPVGCGIGKDGLTKEIASERWNTRFSPLLLVDRAIIDVKLQHDFIQIVGSGRCGLRGCTLGVLEHAWIPPLPEPAQSPDVPEEKLK